MTLSLLVTILADVALGAIALRLAKRLERSVDRQDKILETVVEVQATQTQAMAALQGRVERLEVRSIGFVPSDDGEYS